MTEFEVQRRLAIVQQSAKSRGYECKLTAANVRLLLSETHCQYTGKPFTPDDPLTFERIDNTKGYIPGNVIPVCKSANELKANSDVQWLCAIKTKILNRHKAYYSNVVKKIASREKKITTKIAYINSQTKLLHGLKLELEQAQLELEEVKRRQDEDRQQANVVDKIESVLNSQPHIGDRYLSTWQKIITHIVKLKDYPDALNITQILSSFGRKSHNIQ